MLPVNLVFIPVLLITLLFTIQNIHTFFLAEMYVQSRADLAKHFGVQEKTLSNNVLFKFSVRLPHPGNNLIFMVLMTYIILLRPGS